MSIIGQLINSSTLSDYTQSGTATWSQVSTYISVTGGANSLYNAERIEHPYYSCLHNSKQMLAFKVKAIGSTSYGTGLGVRDDIGGRFCLINFHCSNGSDRGKIQLITSTGSLVFATSLDALTISVNDIIYLEVDRVGTLLDIIAVNLTTQTRITMQHEFTKEVGTNYIWRTGKFGIYTCGGSYDYYNHNVFSNERTGNDVLFVGDSITMSSNASKYEYSWVNRSMDGKESYKYAINAGGGDTTQSVLNKIPELLNQSKANGIIVLLIGTNDILQSISQETIEDNYNEIVDTLEANNRRVILINLIRSISTDVSDFRDFINTKSITNKVIDMYTLFEGSGITPDSKYYSDSVHPNIWGHKIMAEKFISEMGDRLK